MPTGSIIQKARKDLRRFVEGSFSVELTLEPNYTNVVYVDGVQTPYTDGFGVLFTKTGTPQNNTITIQGLATRHRQSYSPDTGLPVVGVNAHCSFCELTLNEMGYATRNTRGDIIVAGWVVSWSDITGIRKYVITTPEPDETLGIIKCTLGDHGSS